MRLPAAFFPRTKTRLVAACPKCIGRAIAAPSRSRLSSNVVLTSRAREQAVVLELRLCR